MFSYCFINVMEKIQSLESRNDQVGLGGGRVLLARGTVLWLCQCLPT